jgi:AhpD family alkylhydroperoxidase
MTPADRERMMLAVASANACRYCMWAHEHWALDVGVDAEDAASVAAGGVGGRDTRERALFAYAVAVGTTGRIDRRSDLGRAALAAAAPDEVARVETVALAMRLANLAGNTFDAWIARLRGRPWSGSRWFDELLISAVFVSGALPVVLCLAILERRWPWTLVFEFAQRNGGLIPRNEARSV